ncbi:hypothetical protein LDENG_00030290 [Lucifuga dentata]|nr:hypothetical protein LDENG_00030290 [Lucifuga dentata]
MEWREQSTVSCDQAYSEAQRWLEAVTKKKFGTNDFRSALENGVLLCDLINKLKPGVIRRINRLPTPIAGLDNLNVFLKACGKLGLKEAQLFHPGDLQDLSSRVTVKQQETKRRLKNVLITIYWLGRRAHCDPFYDGPDLNLKAFEGLLGTALYKALQESSSQKGSNVRDSGFGDSCISSDTTLKGSSEGCCSDTEADCVFRMAENKNSVSYRRSLVITPKASTQFDQFLPTKDKPTSYVPAPLRKKRVDTSNEDNRRSWTSPMYTDEDGTFTSILSETRLSSDSHGNDRVSQSALPAPRLQLAYEYESGSDSDAERPDPDLVLDDLASRRFHSPSPAPPTNFAVPISPLAEGRLGQKGPWPKVAVTPSVPPQNVTCLSSSDSGKKQPPQQGSMRGDHCQTISADILFREMYNDSEDEDDEVGYGDPIQDDLYARKVGVKAQPAGSVSHNKFLPKFWTPEEDIHIQKIKMGSQRRPWYKKMQGFSPHTQPHTTPQPHKQQLVSPPMAFPPVDPTSGPKLVKCQKWPLFGRQDPREPPDTFDYESIFPDLANDDMFARRRNAFQSNIGLAMMKIQLSAKRRQYTSEPQLNIIMQPQGRGSNKEEILYPDIEQDDVVYRKEKTQQQHPLSGAPDHYAPMPVPEPWALPPNLKARLLCPPCPLTQKPATNKQNNVVTEMHPKTDDMLVRKLGVFPDQSQRSLKGQSANRGTPSVPTSCEESDLQKWKAIREASQLRHKKRLLVETFAFLSSKK